MLNNLASDMNGGNSIEHHQLKEEIQNDSASVINDDNMVVDINEDDMEADESSDEEVQASEPVLKDHTAFSQLQREKDNVLYLLEIGMSFIESLTKATRENSSLEDARDDCKSNITDFYETLLQMKTSMARHIYMSSLHSPLNYEGSLYTEKKRMEIENKKAKILTLEPSIGKSGSYTDDFSSVNTFNNPNNLDNISQSNISGYTTQTPNRM